MQSFINKQNSLCSGIECNTLTIISSNFNSLRPSVWEMAATLSRPQCVKKRTAWLDYKKIPPDSHPLRLWDTFCRIDRYDIDFRKVWTRLKAFAKMPVAVNGTAQNWILTALCLTRKHQYIWVSQLIRINKIKFLIPQYHIDTECHAPRLSSTPKNGD